ncbi:MAG TPA: hypothetical protein VF531_02915 [Bacillota bacterium]
MKLRYRSRFRALLPFYAYSGILSFLLGLSGVLLSNGTAAILVHRTVRQFEAWNGNLRNYWQQETGQWIQSPVVPADTTAVPEDDTTIPQLIVGYPEKPGIAGFDSWFLSMGRRLDQKFPGWISIPFKPSNWPEQSIYGLSQEYDRGIFIGFNIREVNDPEKPAIQTDLYLYLPDKGMSLYGSKIAAAVLARIGDGSLRKQDRGIHVLYEISWAKRIEIIRNHPLEANSEYWSGLTSTLDALLEQFEPDRRTGIRFD